jgi:hypothetical protein
MAKQKQKFTWVRFTADYAEWEAGAEAELVDWLAERVIDRGVAVMRAQDVVAINR